MLYQITVKVDADSVYHQPYRLEVDHFIIDVIIGENNVVTAFSIALKVNNYHNFLPQVTSDIKSKITQINLRDESLSFSLIDLAKHIESLGSFWIGIKKNYWESPKRSWIAETPQEEIDLKFAVVNDFHLEHSENKYYRKLFPEMLTSLIKNRHIHHNLVLPMSFFREGCNDFISRRYTN